MPVHLKLCNFEQTEVGPEVIVFLGKSNYSLSQSEEKKFNDA
jgi:hypothetical protein